MLSTRRNLRLNGDYACCAAEFVRARQPRPWFRSPMLSFQMENAAFVSWEAVRTPAFPGRTWFFSFVNTKWSCRILLSSEAQCAETLPVTFFRMWAFWLVICGFSLKPDLSLSLQYALSCLHLFLMLWLTGLTWNLYLGTLACHVVFGELKTNWGCYRKFLWCSLQTRGANFYSFICSLMFNSSFCQLSHGLQWWGWHM